ncbi:MAG: hypothetical protein KF787_01820 [Phycisphaeraceae bacterium]|nr:hypothetical protein [Phycisphaerae bacterium]MBX3391361.1 hypothetical protein [Phycisphaeraceae bacterium]HRJ50631.1 hypothetical protein [Phycisphaerales bacterium]
MGPTNKAYNEVKAILGKLDRSIDDARKRRLDTGPRTPSTPVPAPVLPPASQDTLLGNGSSNAAPPPAMRPSSIFGRAQPIRPTGN